MDEKPIESLIEKKLGESIYNEFDKDLGESKLNMSEFSTVKKDQEEVIDLRKVYVKDYGVHMEMPGYYIDCAKIVPH